MLPTDTIRSAVAVAHQSSPTLPTDREHHAMGNDPEVCGIQMPRTRYGCSSRAPRALPHCVAEALTRYPFALLSLH